jgi:hypothetical protein
MFSLTIQQQDVPTYPTRRLVLEAAQQVERRSTGLKGTWLRLRVMRAMRKWTARDVVH